MVPASRGTLGAGHAPTHPQTYLKYPMSRYSQLAWLDIPPLMRPRLAHRLGGRKLGRVIWLSRPDDSASYSPDSDMNDDPPITSCAETTPPSPRRWFWTDSRSSRSPEPGFAISNTA